MTSDQQFLLGLAAHLVTVLVALIAAVSSTRNTRKLDEVHKTVNGKSDQEKAYAVYEAWKKGIEEGHRVASSQHERKDE